MRDSCICKLHVYSNHFIPFRQAPSVSLQQDLNSTFNHQHPHWRLVSYKGTSTDACSKFEREAVWNELDRFFFWTWLGRVLNLLMACSDVFNLMWLIPNWCLLKVSIEFQCPKKNVFANKKHSAQLLTTIHLYLIFRFLINFLEYPTLMNWHKVVVWV